MKNKAKTMVVLGLAGFVVSGWACKKHDKDGCGHFTQCRWNDEIQKCELSFRGMNSDADNRQSSTTFAGALDFFTVKK